MKFKGPVFPSFRNPPQPKLLNHSLPSNIPVRALPKGKSWLSHNGRKARLRYLRHSCRYILASKNLQDIFLMSELKALVSNEPEIEYGFLHLVFKAGEAAEETGATWAQSAQYMLDKYKDQIKT